VRCRTVLRHTTNKSLLHFERLVMKLALILAVTTAMLIAYARMLLADRPATAGTVTIALINNALADARPQATEDRLVTLRAAAKGVLQARPNNFLIASKLKKALDQADGSVEKQVKSLQTALAESAAILNFRMKKEAAFPQGFQEPAALGEIQLKHYPAYRLARVSSRKEGTFFTLFNHIKSNKIEMTAPVEMRFDEANQGYRQVDMAFLYGAPDWGRLGDAGQGVMVQDVPEMSTVAIGLTGDFDPNSSIYIEALESWLARNATNYERDGQVRVMGYNSPFVWKSQRFFEIEIPVRKRTEVPESTKS